MLFAKVEAGSVARIRTAEQQVKSKYEASFAWSFALLESDTEIISATKCFGPFHRHRRRDDPKE